ncbi:hypothetical protein ACIBBG_16340 [Micromonospora chersina]|uniref:hypothetical protein n=1 Tax=Micromonospora chersina TaxID=47854 RepID=UPI00378BAB03
MASILVEIRAEMEDGTLHDVVADQRDIARWEIQDFGCRFAAIHERMHLGLRWLAWSALGRRGQLPDVDGKPMTWDQFDAACVEARDQADDDEEPAPGEGFADADPGTPAPSEGSSSSSPGAPGSR